MWKLTRGITRPAPYWAGGAGAFRRRCAVSMKASPVAYPYALCPVSSVRPVAAPRRHLPQQSLQGTAVTMLAESNASEQTVSRCSPGSRNTRLIDRISEGYDTNHDTNMTSSITEGSQAIEKIGGPELMVLEPRSWKLSPLALFGQTAALWDDESSRDSAVERRQDSSVGLSELREVPVSCLFWSSDPFGKVRNIAVIWNESAAHSVAVFQLEQKLARLCHRRAVRLSLSKHTHKAQFSDGTRCQFRNASRRKAFHPVRDPRMELMLQYGKREQSIHVQ
jgi:hypothetical protein